MELLERLRRFAEQRYIRDYPGNEGTLTEAADLLEEALKALEDLEAANEKLCATRSRETFLSMIERDEATLELIQLDEARANARAILTKSQGEKIDG